MNKEKDIRFERRKKLRAGFSLGEVLAAVAIIAILAAVGAVSAVNMYKNMKSTQLDKTAETIFHAAQDRLSELYAYGREDSIDKDHGGTEVAGYEDRSVLYIRSDDDSTAKTAIMGDDTVIGDIYSNYWAIEYQASTCRVLNVVYAEKNDSGLGGFGKGIEQASTLDELVAALTHHTFEGRENKFGWYGEKIITPLLSTDKQVGNTSVDAEIINEENLYAHVRVSVGWEDNLKDKNEVKKFLENVNLTLTIKDTKSDASKDFTLLPITADKLMTKEGITGACNDFFYARSDGDSDSGVDYIKNKYLTASWDVLLDSLQAKAFTGSNPIRTFDGYSSGITPGNDFYFIVKLESKAGLGVVPTVQDYDVDNSLFAGASTSGDKVYIEYGRHLQNLGKARVSGFNAVQIADLDFNANVPDGVTRLNDLDKYNKFWASVYTDSGSLTYYFPKDSAYLKSYDGQNHIIKNLDIGKIDVEGAASPTSYGILGELSYAGDTIEIKNVIITDSSVNTEAASAAGMFAAKVSGSAGVKVDNCYLDKVTIDGSDSASLGGFFGEISSAATAQNCAFANVKLGTKKTPAISGAFAGKITAALNAKNLYAFGGEVKAASNAGGLIGSCEADSANVVIKGSKVNGTAVNASIGNAGGIVGNTKNAEFTISQDSAAVGCVVKSSSGNAGGLVGKAESVVNITDSEYYILSEAETLGENKPVAGKVSKEFAKTWDLTVDTPKALLTYAHIHDKAGFKYLDEMKGSDIAGSRWISGYGNVGGLVGESTGNITVQNSFAAGVLSAATNAGGFVGSTSGKLIVNSSYADFYLSGNNVGGFAAACGDASEFHSCYTAGFLVGNATKAAGFAPVNVGNISDSYSVFNFDNVCGFTGPPGQDADHDLNTNGTVSNYPEVSPHSACYPIAPSSSGKAYYVYTATEFTDTASCEAVTANELAANKKDGGGTLLTGDFVTDDESGSTVPYVLSSFFGTKLAKYPFPSLKVDKITDTDGSASKTALNHYNDWLTFDGKNDIEIWYLMYDENLKELKTDVAGFGGKAEKLARRTKAVSITTPAPANTTEYQMNLGKHTSFSGFRFVGYYDPDTAKKVGATTFDRAAKLDYLSKGETGLSQSINSSMKTGDRVVQTAINGANTFGKQCASHASILRPDDEGKKKLYAVYRYNKPYTVTLSYIEYELPKSTATTETKTLEKIYTDSKRVASMDKFQVTYTEPADGYEIIYQNNATVRAKVQASHSKLSRDEELTEDYIAEEELRGNTDALARLDAKRAAKNQSIPRDIPSFKSSGFDLLNFQALYNHVPRLITQEYLNYVTNTMHVYTITRLGPSIDSDGNTVAFNNRERTEVTKDNNNRINLSTHKAFDYVILYNSDSGNRRLNLVFRNSEANESGTIPEVDDYSQLKATVGSLPVNRDGASYTVTVGSDGFTDTDETLVDLMNPNTPPTFVGFTLNKNDSVYPGNEVNQSGLHEATLYYDRNKYSLSFALNNNSENPVEKYKTSQTRATIDNLYYGELYQNYLWETTKVVTTEPPLIEGPSINQLKSASNIEVGEWKYEFYYNSRRDYGYKWVWHRSSFIGTYSKLEEYVQGLQGNEGSFYLRFNNRNSRDNYSWKKVEESTITYAFNRTGYLLSGFDVYVQTASGEYRKEGDTVTSIEKVLNMPDANVKVEPVWIINPSKLRVELYYQSAYDDITATDKTKEYEFGAVASYNLTNGAATGVTRTVGSGTDTLNINNLIQIEDSSDKNAYANYLDSFLRAGNFNKREEHEPSKTYPYVLNNVNTLNKGYHHFIDNETMVVALYYDRAKVSYTFHFINSGSYKFNSGGEYTISNQWADIMNASDSIYNYWDGVEDLDNYTGSDKGKKLFGQAMHKLDGSEVKVSTHALVSCYIEDEERKPNTDMTYGGLRGNDYKTSTTTTKTVKYGIAVNYTAYYGAPTEFDDGTTLIPYWYCNMGSKGVKKLQRYIIAGSSATRSTYYQEHSIKYFSDINSNTSWQVKDMYPYYPPSSAGTTYFYIEVAKYDDPSFTNARNKPTENVAIGGNSFARFVDSPYKETFGKNANTIFRNNEGYRKFIDGYTTYAIKLEDGKLEYTDWWGEDHYYEDQTIFRDDLPESTGNNYNTLRIYLERNQYSIELADATLNEDAGFDTAYLYKQKILKLPSASQITGTKGDEFTFDGWYTSSMYTTKIADKNGNILDSYKNSGLALVDTDEDLLMNYQNMQIFAKWAPRICTLSFNPFFPDLQGDSSLIIPHDPVDYETVISVADAPVLSLPAGHANRFFEDVEEDGKTVRYYIIKNDSGRTVGRYKFLGWFTHSGRVAPTGPEELENEYVFGETPITDDTVLYAKWEKVYAEALYTINCIDYSTGDVIFSVLRSGDENSSLTLNPANLNADTSNDIEILTGGTYSILNDYDSLSGSLTTTIKDGDVYKFDYKKKASWEFVVKNCINVPNGSENGEDIVINSRTVITTYLQHQLDPSIIPGYSVYEYQIGGGDAVEVTDASEYIPVLKPQTTTDPLVVICRYRLDGDVIASKAEAEYYKYDPIDWFEHENGVFDWEDSQYAPAILYTVGAGTDLASTYEFIGSGTSDESSAAAIKAISALPAGLYNNDRKASMQLVAMKKDGSSHLPVKVLNDDNEEVDVIVQTDVTIKVPYYVLTFKGNADLPDGVIYYAFAGENQGFWYWDEELDYRIGADGTKLVIDLEQSTLPDSIKASAKKVIDIIEATKEDEKYKVFFIVIKTSEESTEAFIIVDDDGILSNGDKLTGDTTVLVDAGSGNTKYTITLYDSEGNIIRTIDVYLP